MCMGPLGGSSYIDLSPYIKNKQCCINVKNNDDECFTWAVQSFIEHKNIKKNHDRQSSYSQDLHTTKFFVLLVVISLSSYTLQFKLKVTRFRRKKSLVKMWYFYGLFKNPPRL